MSGSPSTRALRLAAVLTALALIVGCAPAPAAPPAVPTAAAQVSATVAAVAPTAVAAAQPAATAVAQAAPTVVAAAQQAATAVGKVNWPTKAADIALYSGADRQAMLEAGAKAEGALTWYGSHNIEDLKSLAEAFMKKYPYVKVDYVNVGGSAIAPRVLQEAQANQTKADIVSTGVLGQIASTNLLVKFNSPAAAKLPKQYQSADGTRAAPLVYDYSFAYNTKLIAPDKAPTKYEDLLDPYWKGNFFWQGPFDAKLPLGILKAKGTEPGWQYLNALTQQVSLREGSTANMNSVIAGEKIGALDVYAYNSERQTAEKGAPLKTVLFSPTVSVPQWLGMMASAPHPYAAMLFVDYIFSEGQQVWADAGQTVASPEVVYKQPYLQDLQKRSAAIPHVVLDEESIIKELPDVQKTLRVAFGLQ